MQVQFTVEEVLAMADAVLDGLAESPFGRADAAAVRRWRDERLTTTSEELRLLAEKVNAELRRTHDHSRKSGIQKPDWV